MEAHTSPDLQLEHFKMDRKTLSDFCYLFVHRIQPKWHIKVTINSHQAMKLTQAELVENQFILRQNFCINFVCNSVCLDTILKCDTHTCFPRGDFGSDAVSVCRHLSSVCKFSKYPCSSFISFSRTTCKNRHFKYFPNKITILSASIFISYKFTEGSMHVLITRAVKKHATV